MATDYKQLVAWQRAISLVTAVYDVTKAFPPDERFGLTNQLRRAAVSVPSNIAEGQGRSSIADFVRFLHIANGSRQEVETQLIIAERLGFVAQGVLQPLFESIIELGRLLSGLVASLEAKLK